MFSFLLKACTDCDNLEDAICAIDGVLAQYGKNAWQNTAFMTIKPIPRMRMRQLLYYREILNHLRWNQDFYCPWGIDKVVSRVKALTGGEFKVARRMKLPTYTTTTTTTTTSTSTTSTTSTTTSTSTSTTTSTSTSTTTSTTTSTSTSTTTTTSTSSTTSTTTTTTTTASPQLLLLNDTSGDNGTTILLVEYDNYPPNNNQNVVGAYPLLPEESLGPINIPASFVPGTFRITVDGDPFGCLTVTGSNGAQWSQSYSGASVYTFTGIIVNNTNPTLIRITGVGVPCLTTSTTTTSTTTNAD